MLKLLFEFATESLSVFENPLHDYVAMAVIGAIAFAAGWEVSPGGRWGAVIHWVARFVVFVLLWAIMRSCVLLYRWVSTIPVGVIMAVVIGVLGLGILAAILLKSRRERVPVSSKKEELK